MKTRQRGFTIVELVIVIVVIAILAAITIVSYAQITESARISTLKSDLAKAAADLQITRRDVGVYPADLASANLKASTGVSYQYTYTPSSNTYCLTGQIGANSWYITQERTEAQQGKCPGHG